MVTVCIFLSSLLDDFLKALKNADQIYTYMMKTEVIHAYRA